MSEWTRGGQPVDLVASIFYESFLINRLLFVFFFFIM